MIMAYMDIQYLQYLIYKDGHNRQVIVNGLHCIWYQVHGIRHIAKKKKRGGELGGMSEFASKKIISLP